MRNILVVLVLLFGASNAAPAPLRPTESPIPNHYIVVLKQSADVTADATKVSSFSGVQVLKEYKSAIRGFSIDVTDPNALNLIREIKDVEFVEQDSVVHVFNNSMTWGLDRIDQRRLPLDGNQDFKGDGRGVNAYIIDTGIYPEHEYFEGRARIGYDSVRDSEWGVDCNGHGTHCAGTVGAKYYGVAPAVNLWGVKVLSCYGSGTLSGVIEGMDWVAANGIKPGVASMSLGGWGSDALDLAVKGLYDAGFAVSVAAGNSDYDACYFSPARAREAISVGATDYRDYRAYFSNKGSCVDIFAPGLDVLSTVIGSPTATATYSGTSMACPHVTGAIAIALGNEPDLTPKQVWEKLKADSTTGVLQDKGPLSPDNMLYVP